MPQTAERLASTSTADQRRSSRGRVKPSRVDSATPFTLDQELELFGSWVDEPIWAPPADRARALAETMHHQTGWFTPDAERWDTVVEAHRPEFTQVREIDLSRASIRLPEGRFYVAVTEQQDFDKIEEEVPACVQTRLEEFLDGPGRRRGVKVYYLKPLCVEVEDDLVLTTREDLMRAVNKVRDEVFDEYHGMAALWRLRDAAKRAYRLATAAPRAALGYFVRRRQKALAAYQAKLEFQRRKTALGAAKNYRKCRTTPCTFDDMYNLTGPIEQPAVARQYDSEKDEKRARRDQFIRMVAEAAPGLLTILGGGGGFIGHIIHYAIWAAPPVALCDPAFVAELPERPGELLKIGHFDEVGGVMHVEI